MKTKRPTRFTRAALRAGLMNAAEQLHRVRATTREDDEWDRGFLFGHERALQELLGLFVGYPRRTIDSQLRLAIDALCDGDGEAEVPS